MSIVRAVQKQQLESFDDEGEDTIESVAEEIFALIDKEKDGVIRQSELEEKLADLGMRLTPEEFRLLRKDLSNNEHTEWVGVEDFIHMLEKNGFEP